MNTETTTVGVTTPTLPTVNASWLKMPAFDNWLILGCFFLAVLTGVTITLNPSLFWPLFYANVWLLGYHHVIATFTRLCFDKESFKEYRFLVLGLPWLVLLGTVAAVIVMGGWTILATVYLYWQWFHYTRQSYGIACLYRRKAPCNDDLREKKVTHAVIYLVPLWGILYRSCQYHQHPGTFLGMGFWAIPVPYWLVLIASIAAAWALIVWVHWQFKLVRSNQFSTGYFLYVLSHVLIFTLSYLVIADITYGWLVVNVWHNAQYILLVWYFNRNRFKSGVSSEHRFLSTLSQGGRYILIYFAICLGISSVFYALLRFGINYTESSGILLQLHHDGWPVGAMATVPIGVVIYQVINFHHYVVDGIIWKIRRKNIRSKLGVAD